MAEIGTDIEKALNLLKKGECVGIPTETVYGLAANALNPNACLKIFEIKKRPAFDPLIVHTCNLDRVKELVSDLPAAAKQLLQHFSPGPITILLPKSSLIPDLVTSGLNTVGIRIPNHPLTLELLHKLEFPLAAPSANPFGYISPTTAQHVNQQLGNELTYILDGGPCQVGIESTIIEFTETLPVIHRLGGLSVTEIEKLTGTCLLNLNKSSNPTAPGQLKSHYAPKTPIDYLQNGQPIEANCGYIWFMPPNKSSMHAEHFVLSNTGDLQEAAQNLFKALREMDNKGLKKLFIEKAPQTGLGHAINDRIERAVAK